MKMFYRFIFGLAIIFNYSECSSNSEENPHGERDPSPSSIEQHTLERTLTEGLHFRTRSRSPASRPPHIRVLGYSIEQLGYIRLIPRTNQNLLFEFRSYIFEAGKPICWKSGVRIYDPVPAGEHIVLSTSKGDIFAILTHSGFFLGIYSGYIKHPRVKMNMMSGRIIDLTPDEKKYCPVGKNHPISLKSFIKASAKSDSLQFKWKSSDNSDVGASSSRRHSPDPPDRSPTSEEPLIRARSMSPPGRPPSDQVLGYTLEQLGYIRLIPCTNNNQRFEFRRYVFPTNKAIQMIITNRRHSFDSNQEYIVLSTSDGDVFAILDDSGTLRGMYRSDKSRARIKINIMSGEYDDMTPDEARDCPVGKNFPIFPKRFSREFSDHNSLQPARNVSVERNSGNPYPARRNSPDRVAPHDPLLEARPSSPPGRPPTNEVLGYTLAKLGYIRLIPQLNPQQKFEFRRYVFPASERIHVLLGHGHYVSLPNLEHIVLSTSDGDVFAILEYTGILRGTYKKNSEDNWSFRRMKINMMNREVNFMTESEIKECHVGRGYPIFPRWFKKVVSRRDSLQRVYH